MNLGTPENSAIQKLSIIIIIIIKHGASRPQKPSALLGTGHNYPPLARSVLTTSQVNFTSPCSDRDSSRITEPPISYSFPAAQSFDCLILTFSGSDIDRSTWVRPHGVAELPAQDVWRRGHGGGSSAGQGHIEDAELQ